MAVRKVTKKMVKKDPPVKKNKASRSDASFFAAGGRYKDKSKNPPTKKKLGKPTPMEKASDNTRHPNESIPDFKKRRNAFRATQAKKRASTAKKKK